MSKKTITKFSAFVISFALVCLIFSGCFSASSSEKKNKNAQTLESDYQNPQVVGKFESGEITESSGIVASKCQPDVLWTHNDSGDDAFVFAFDAKGKNLGAWRVAGAKNIDWEDIATIKNDKGECFLYLADIGNNKLSRSELVIYRVREPQVSEADKSSDRKNPAVTENAEAIRIEYPDTRHNAETLMVHPQSGDIYILSKEMSNPSGVYKLAANYSLDKTNKMEKIAAIAVPAIPDGLLTGGDIAPDGRRAIICDYFSAYEIALPEKAKNFDEIWKQKIDIVALGERKIGEAVGYAADGNSIFATSEEKYAQIIQVKKKS